MSATRELLDQVTRRGLTDPDRLWDYLAEHGGLGKLPPDAAQTAELLVRDGLLTPYQAEQLLTGSDQPLVIGRYRLLARLGERTFLGERSNGQRAALYLCPGDAPRPVTRPHPNLVPILDHESAQGQVCVIREYIEGESLAEKMHRHGPLAPVPAARAVLDVARGLSHLHVAGIGHGRVQLDQCIEEVTGKVRLLPGGGGDPETDRTQLATLLATLSGNQALPGMLQDIVSEQPSAEAVTARLEAWLGEVAPPPLIDPKGPSSQGLLRRPELHPAEEEADDLLAEESPPTIETTTLVAGLIAALALAAAVLLWWMHG